MITKHHVKEAKDLIRYHLDTQEKNSLYGDTFVIAKQHAITTCKVLREQFILSDKIVYWDNVIKAIQNE